MDLQQETNASNNRTRRPANRLVSPRFPLQQRAKREAAIAVINIKSVLQEENVESDTEYLCGAGTFLSGVALRGTVVKFKAGAKKK